MPSRRVDRPRGKLLCFTGRPGFSGKALELVTSHKLEAVGTDSTQLMVSMLRCADELELRWDGAIHEVWHHFL